jgi:DNA-binding NarL/FixJ family response regulator
MSGANGTPGYGTLARAQPQSAHAVMAEAAESEAREHQAGPRRLRGVAVDEHPAIRAALTATLEAQEDMQLCGVVETAEQVYELVEHSGADVAVVDLSLADASGLEIVEGLRSRSPQTAIVVFSFYDAAFYASRALAAGAKAYVMKSESTRAVAEAIRMAARHAGTAAPRA